MAKPEAQTVVQGGRAKAYRPIRSYRLRLLGGEA